MEHATDQKWDSRIVELDPSAICLMLTPKRSQEGLHRVVLGLEEDERHVELGELAQEIEPFSAAYTDAGDRQDIENFQFTRSHSPRAGMSEGPRAGQGYGYVLYSTLALRVAGGDRSRGGVFSPVDGASESAEAMWTNFVDIGAAELTDGDEEEVEVSHCESIADSSIRHRGRSATITDSEICGEVSATIDGSESVRFLAAWHILQSGWLLDWRGAQAWFTRVGNKYPSSDHRSRARRDWKSNPEVLMRADPGPDATPAQVLFLADRILALTDHLTHRRFLQREDIFAKLPAKMRDYYHPDQTGMHFLSGVGRSGAARLGTTGTQLRPQLRPQALPAPSAAYEALVSRWSALDF